ncbi:MAG: hypothetical protein PVI06_09080 [Desulfobacterales bacterium]
MMDNNGKLGLLKGYHDFSIPLFRHLFSKVRISKLCWFAMPEVFWTLTLLDII